MPDDKVKEEEGDEGGPGAAYRLYTLSEELLEKLRLLNYDSELCVKRVINPIPRHYFSASTKPGQQFLFFISIAAWLSRKAGRSFEQPEEDDDPNGVISAIVNEVKAAGKPVDFPPSKLKQGSGDPVLQVLHVLADRALETNGFTWRKPQYPQDEINEGVIEEDEAEVDADKQEDEEDNEDVASDIDEGPGLDLEALNLRNLNLKPVESSKPEEILESTTDASEWMLELERVLPQLKVTVRADTKDWRIHLEQMNQYREGIEKNLESTKSQLDKLMDDITRSMEKILSREKHVNNQLEHNLGSFRTAQDRLNQVKEKYKQCSGGVTEKARKLAEISDEAERIKREMEERSSNVTDGAPLKNIRASIERLKLEVQHMDVRVGVIDHTLLQSELQNKAWVD